MINNVLKDETPFRLSFVQTGDGGMTTDPYIVKDTADKYFQNIFKGNQCSFVDIQSFRIQHPKWADIFEVTPSSTILLEQVVSPITELEVIEQIKSNKSNSSPGPNNISYAHFKILAESAGYIQILTGMFNQALIHNSWPNEWNKGTIALLLKKSQYTGQMSELRPITLLQTGRKLFTGIITDRLSKTVYNNNILKGGNFGFTPGVSTNDYVTIFRHLIDHAKLKNKQLYAILLDIQKAYDSVPMIALKICLQRIGASERLINIISMLMNNRELRISTDAGLSQGFIPENGLPQGDKISPILWNIFYDPLLTMINTMEGYHFEDSTKISQEAFADDLTLIDENLQNIQPKLNVVAEYLGFFFMQVSAPKTILATNQSKAELDEIKQLGLHINNVPLTDIRHREELVRVLGVFFTLDGNHKATVTHALAQIEGISQRIKMKYTPADITTYLTNSVMIPILAYRLQVSHVSERDCKAIDIRMRELNRRKWRFMQSNNVLLYDKEFGIGLDNFQTILEQRQVTNTLLHVRSLDKVGEITRHMVKLFTKKLKLVEPIFICPISQEYRPNPFTIHISNVLYSRDLQFRTIEENDKDNFSRALTTYSYDIYKNEINKINNIIPFRFLADITRSDKMIKSFDNLRTDIYNTINKSSNKSIHKTYNQLQEYHETYPYYQAIAGLYMP